MTKFSHVNTKLLGATSAAIITRASGVTSRSEVQRNNVRNINQPIWWAREAAFKEERQTMPTRSQSFR